MLGGISAPPFAVCNLFAGIAAVVFAVCESAALEGGQNLSGGQRQRIAIATSPIDESTVCDSRRADERA